MTPAGVSAQNRAVAEFSTAPPVNVLSAPVSFKVLVPLAVKLEATSVWWSMVNCAPSAIVTAPVLKAARFQSSGSR